MTDQPPDDGADPREVDAVLSALANEHAREVVRYFRSADEEVATVETLVAHLARREAGHDDRGHLAVILYHRVLPSLADAGILEYDPRSRTARYRGTPVVADCLAYSTPTAP